jgi:DNA polymerase elongation subunit (family B)
MFQSVKKENILFLDIETVPQSPSFELLSPRMQDLWAKKTRFQRKEEDTPASFYERAGIYAEFGKIVCISVGFFTHSEERKFRLKSFSGEDESLLLSDFVSLLNAHFSSKEQTLCGHNGKEFDFPYIARRILINGLKLPVMLDISGKKPWETQFLDTLELWKFGDFKNYVSLDLHAAIFDIKTPKDDIDGSEVGRVYWVEKDLKRIATYCLKDVITLASVFLRFRGEAALEENEVVYL